MTCPCKECERKERVALRIAKEAGIVHECRFCHGIFRDSNPDANVCFGCERDGPKQDINLGEVGE